MEPIEWPGPSLDGFALAATLAGDRDAALAGPGLAASARSTLCALPLELASLTRANRHARVAELTQQVAQHLGLHRLQPGLREQVRHGLAPAQARPGFALDRGLAALLLRLASQP